MKILFYGVGPLGSLYSSRLKESGQDVSVLARGQRLEDIRKHGIVLEDSATGHRTTTHIEVVERLDPKDTYDLVVVLMRKNKISDILPALSENHNSPNVLFMCNNVSGPSEMTDALARERVLLGFAGAGGYFKDHAVIYEVVSGRQQPTMFGELDGDTTPRVKQIAEAFKGAGFPVAVSNNMDAWLKTHAAEILPTGGAFYMAGIDNYRLSRTRDSLVLMVRAIREGYKVLNANDIPITPSNHKIFNWIPEPLLIALMKRMLSTKTAETVMVGHAKSAQDEIKQMADDFTMLARKTSVPTPAMDRLFKHIDPSIEPIEEGSAQIPMNWKGVWVGLGMLTGLVLLLFFLFKMLFG
jgi:2-dehydropantoate 2-reductase